MVKGKTILFLVHLVLGLYFINASLNFVVIPEFMDEFNKWVILAGGLIILFGGFRYLKAGKKLDLALK